MEDDKLEQSIIKGLELDNLLLPDDLTSEEKTAHASVVTDYLSRPPHLYSIDSSEINTIVEIEIEDSWLEPLELELNKLSNDELFDLLNEEPVTRNSTILFPKIRRINELFSFLHHLGNLDIKDSKLVVVNKDEISIKYYQLVEAAIFFGYLETVKEEDDLYLLPTEQYEAFLDETPEEQYVSFLKSIGRNETIREILTIQVNDTIFDRISKQMVHNILVEDIHLKEEGITSEEMEELINNFRIWFLNIRNVILEN